MNSTKTETPFGSLAKTVNQNRAIILYMRMSCICPCLNGRLQWLLPVMWAMSRARAKIDH